MWYYTDEDALNIDIDIIKKFSFVKVTPPLNKQEIERAIKELTERKQ